MFDDQFNTQGGGLSGMFGSIGQESAIFEKNMKALAFKSPQAAQQIRSAATSSQVRFIETDEGIESIELNGVALASKRYPMREAKRFAEKMDPAKVACCAVNGFGMGYHCGTLLERLGESGIIVCFEPDLGLLRAVLERVDYAKMFETGRLFLVTDPDDPARVSQIFTGIEAVVGLGVEILNHPPSANRLGDLSGRFGKIFSDVLRATRTHVVTTLANSQVSFRNSIMNLDYYTTSSGILPLKDSCISKPAVVVSAGPSLQRNLDVLAEPGVRDSVVIIAVQTVLKQMLAKGVKPHFVAALDYHEISKRFYEGLTKEDVEGVRLVVEPKANPAILDAFPGEVVCVADDQLDRLLGDEIAREMGEVTRGGTVAHLCYYLARYLGCDPVILIGQDLGFTDGQYYSAGAAIHQVWSGELNAHNTLEMMEWERIVRMRGLLRTREDVHGRPIYLDEQMATYLAQFESDFEKDTQQGLTVVDATEGGVRKLHTNTMTLRDAIKKYAQSGTLTVPSTSEHRMDDQEQSKRVQVRLELIIADSERIAYLSEKSIGLLEAIQRNQKDQRKVNKIIGEVFEIRDQVAKMDVAFSFSEAVNQVGVLNRMKRDRNIALDPDADVYERQRMQIDRDIVNVQWTCEASRAVAQQLRDGRDVLSGVSDKETCQIRDRKNKASMRNQESECLGATKENKQNQVHAVVMADPEFGGLGTRRDLGKIIHNSMNALQLTLARLNKCEQLDGITIITPDPDSINTLIGSAFALNGFESKIQVVGVEPQRFRARSASVGSARVQSSECWRGSIGMLSVYDEQVDIGQLAKVMHEHEIDGCAIVGADWAMIDHALIDQTVLVYRSQDNNKRIAFSQAVPGLGTMVIDRETIDSLAISFDRASGETDARRNHFATIGALVGYIPTVPQFDPIAKGVCVQVDPAVRDAGVRMIADSHERCMVIQQAYEAIDQQSDGASQDANAARCVEAFLQASSITTATCPRTIVLETCTGRLASGDWGMWKQGSVEPVERKVISLDSVHKLFKEASALREDVAVVFDGIGDPLMHPQAMSFVQLAKEDGVACVELRSDLLCDKICSEELLESGIDILSIDVLAQSNEVYKSLTGIDQFDDVFDRLQGIFDELAKAPSDHLWFVPRITRCDRVYNEIESFYDKWLMICGSVVIDPLPEHLKEQRIQRLPIPQTRQAQLDQSTMHIQCDGIVVDRHGKPIGSINVFEVGVEKAYQQMQSATHSSEVEPKPGQLSEAAARIA